MTFRFHVRAGGNDEGELYAEAGPDIIQQRRKFLQEQAVPPEEPNGQYATIGSKRSSTLAQSPNRPAPPYPGKAAPPYHEKVGSPTTSLPPPYPARMSFTSESLDSTCKPPIDSPVRIVESGREKREMHGERV